MSREDSEGPLKDPAPIGGGKISPDDVLALSKPTEGFLCPLAANVYCIEFLSFRIRDMTESETSESGHGRVIFEVDRDSPETLGRASAPAVGPDASADELERAVRTIQYHFPRSFLRRRTVATRLVFSVGSREVPSFRMVERHYFRERLVKSFDFSFTFCIPNSTNAWETIYDMPELTPDEEQEIVDNPFASKSDSFYFVNNELVMHNKAEYAYDAPEPEANV